jgi:hypothetical protein
MQPNPERRKHPREPTAELIRFSFPLSYACFMAELTNIGEGGLGLVSDCRIDVGQRLFIRPFVSGSYGFCSRMNTGCPVRVRWCRALRRGKPSAYAIGVAFQSGNADPACRF